MLISFVLIFSGAVALCFLLPKIYRASTLILVEPQQIPEDYVKATVTSGIQDRLNTIKQQILSRTRLERVIQELDLQEDIVKGGSLSEMIREMRKNIFLDVKTNPNEMGGGASAFSIHYQGRDPELVMKVTNKLASLFIEENLKVREEQARGTSDFLEKQLDDVGNELELHEKEIREFKQKHIGELPEQQETNLRMLDQLQVQKQSLLESLRSAENHRVLLEGQLSEMKSIVSGEGRRSRLEEELGELKSELTNLRTRYTERYPDIIQLRKRIAEMEEQLVSEPGKERSDTIIGSNNPIYQSLRNQSQVIILEISSMRAELAHVDEQIRAFQARVENAPRREQELMTLTRDYENIKTNYQSLLRKKLNAEIAEDLEKRRKSEQFRILDPATLPDQIYKPNRKRILLIGFLFALGTGLGMVLFMEYTDRSFRGAEDLKAYVDLPVLATIPLIAGEGKQNFKRRHWPLKPNKLFGAGNEMDK